MLPQLLLLDESAVRIRRSGISLAALICTKPGQRPWLIYRVQTGRRQRNDRRKGFTETGYVRLLDAAHEQLGVPIVLVWDNLNTHTSRAWAT